MHPIRERGFYVEAAALDFWRGGWISVDDVPYPEMLAVPRRDEGVEICEPTPPPARVSVFRRKRTLQPP